MSQPRWPSRSAAPALAVFANDGLGRAVPVAFFSRRSVPDSYSVFRIKVFHVSRLRSRPSNFRFTWLGYSWTEAYPEEEEEEDLRAFITISTSPGGAFLIASTMSAGGSPNSFKFPRKFS